MKQIKKSIYSKWSIAFCDKYEIRNGKSICNECENNYLKKNEWNECQICEIGKEKNVKLV